MRVSVKIHDLGLTRDLERTAKKAVPYAIRQALNDIAFAAKGHLQGNIRKEFILRNKWTERSVMVERARGLNPRQMQSAVFSKLDYLEKQEHGGTSTHAVPTGVATGEGRGANPRRKLVRRPNQVSAIALGERARKGSRKQRNAAAIHMAAKQGKKFVFLQLQRKIGLFKIRGGKRKPMVDMIWDTSQKSHRIKPTKTLEPAVARAEVAMPKLMTNALIKQLRMHKVFGY